MKVAIYLRKGKHTLRLEDMLEWREKGIDWILSKKFDKEPISFHCVENEVIIYLIAFEGLSDDEILSIFSDITPFEFREWRNKFQDLIGLFFLQWAKDKLYDEMSKEFDGYNILKDYMKKYGVEKLIDNLKKCSNVYWTFKKMTFEDIENFKGINYDN